MSSHEAIPRASTGASGRIEVITGHERRLRYSDVDKARLEHRFAVAAIQRSIAARSGLTDAAPRPGVLRGHVERIVAHPEGLLVEGRVMDAGRPNRVQELELLRVSMAPLPVVANHYRVDLDYARVADGCCGFSQVVSAGSGDILVRRMVDGAMLPGPLAIARAA